MKTNKIKFCVQHLPLGSIARFHVVGVCEKIGEVIGYETNMECSDLIVLRFQNEDEEFDTININWCVEIIKRGTGVASVKYVPPSSLVQYDYFATLYKFGGCNYKRNHYATFSLHDLIPVLLKDIDVMKRIDGDSLMRELIKQSFVQKIKYGQFDCLIFRINKKRAKRWMQQNYNRFLMSNREIKEMVHNLYSSPNWYTSPEESDFDDLGYPEERDFDDLWRWICVLSHGLHDNLRDQKDGSG